MPDYRFECSRQELIAALKQWDVDAPANGWTARTDDERFADTADYLHHTIHVARQAPAA